MGLRDFTDSKGTTWKVWDVTPDQLDRRTAAEDYMADWQDGWLCFECGEERRRLARYPTRWVDLADEEMEKLLQSAQPVKRRKHGETTGEYSRRAEAARAKASRPDAGRLTPPAAQAAVRRRRIVDEHGRAFSVNVQRLQPEVTSGGKVDSSPGSVLRFTCGNLMLDLEQWPEDWERLSDQQLLMLLAHARPASGTPAAESPTHRRHTDA